MKILYFNFFQCSLLLLLPLSLGNYLCHYAEEAGKIITAAKIISVPWNIEKG